MPTIILTILKIIGIILLVLLGLVITIVCIVLFVPIRYRAEGSYHGDYSVQARVTWLLHLVSVRVSLSSNQKLRILVRILGIPLYDTARPPKERKPKKQRRKKAEPIQERETETPMTSGQELLESPEPPKQPEPQIHVAASELPAIEEPTDETESTEEQFSFLKKLQLFFSKIIQFLQNLEYTFRRIYDTIVNIKSNIQYYCDVLTQEETAAAWKTARRQVIRIWRNLQPRRWHVYLHIGMDDPATMGNILGIWGALYPLHEGRVEMESDFEQRVFEGEAYCRGRVTLYVFLWTAYLFFFDKNIKHLKKCLLREEK